MSAVPVLTAVTDSGWESELLAALESVDLGVRVVRRCVDLADLLATAATGTASAVLVSADLRRLDRDALSRLDVSGVVVVGLVEPGDAAGEQRLRQLGVRVVLPADGGAAEVSAAVVAAVALRCAQGGREGAGHGYADPLAGLDGGGDPPAAVADTAQEPPVAADTGRLVAVWGPTGAPGRTMVAVGLATQLARRGRRTLLVDADVYGGVVAAWLGLLDESPGLAAAARAAQAGRLDLPALAALARSVAPDLRVLTGISRSDRWPELRPAAVDAVLSCACSLAEVTVVDCGFCLEQDEELAYDTAAPRRNGATLATLAAADTVLTVGSADAIGLQRLVRGLGQLRDVLPDVVPTVVVNRTRRRAAGGDSRADVEAALTRFAGVQPVAYLPFEPTALDAALATGRTLTEADPNSPLAVALSQLADALLGVPTAPARERRWRRR